MIARQFLQNVLSHDKQMEILSALFCEYNNILDYILKLIYEWQSLTHFRPLADNLKNVDVLITRYTHKYIKCNHLYK